MYMFKDETLMKKKSEHYKRNELGVWGSIYF